ncbi:MULTISPECIES: FG-GAP-like repeat-containing protein [unclassified Anabaena]|uniref:FG-GAP-like repeat-containing protein n=1 Tax=unclassified Anabaena TaxID=2619674 RepID=UPI0039C6C468
MSLSFTNAKNFTVGTNPSLVTVEDFDGDGKLDLVVVNPESNNVSVLLNDGNDGFGTATNFTVGTSPSFVTVADFNGDGKLDLAVVNSESNDVSVLLNNGNGGFGTATNFTVGTKPTSVVVGDFNRNGQLDLAVVNTDSVSVLLNDGNGGFGAATDFSVETSPTFITAADFDGDGQLDLVVANSDSNTVSVLLNDGNGGFGAATSFAVGTKPTSLVVGDFNSNGKLDLAVVNAESNNVSVLLNDGHGDFGAATNFAVGTKPTSLVMADLNYDGKLDLAVVNAESNNVSVLLNDGHGDFGTATNFAVGTKPTSLVVTDFNHDGKSDLVVANSDADTVSVLLNKGDGSFDTATDFVVGKKPTSVVVADFNHDGKSDLVVTNSDADTVSLLLRNSAPLDVVFTNTTVDDDDTVVGIFKTFDLTKNEKHVYSLVVGAGDTDNDIFIIEENKLKLKSTATKSTYNVRIRTTDSSGLFFDKDLTVNVNNFNSAIVLGQATTIVQLVNITENIFNVKSKIKGNKAKISIKIKGGKPKGVNEIGVFVVDDAQGTIDGIAPGEVGYAEVALKRSKVVLSAIAKAPKGFNIADLSNLLEFDSDAQLRFYMVRNSTTNAVITGKTSFSQVIFSSETNVTVESLVDESFSLTWKGASNDGSDLVLNIKETNEDVPLGTGLQGKFQGEVIDLRQVTTEVKAEFIVNREAAFNNFIGFCQVADEDGGIDIDGDGIVDVRPGDAGYVKAAITNRVQGIDLKVNNQGKANFNGVFKAGFMFAPFIISNTTVEAVLSSNAENLSVFFPYLGANPGGVNHIRLLANNVFGFEDQVGGGDLDYNDMIVQVNLTIA